MASFLDKFPGVSYDITKNKISNYQYVTNITFRLRIIKEAIENTSAYMKYVITDTDTPEILAETVYGNPEAYWIIFYANDIVDPQYDWPLNTRAFTNYIIDKYGSIANAKTTYHHYEKVIERKVDDITSTFAIEINKSRLTDQDPGVPFDYYDDPNLPSSGTYETFTVNGKTVYESIYKRAITNYDWEEQQNEKKREIKIIKADYYPKIMTEFNDLTNPDGASFIRKLRY